MSTMGAGAPPSGYDNLSALLEFVKSPDYVDRIKEMRDLEDSSRRAHDDAQRAIADAQTVRTQLASDRSKYESDARQLANDRAAHDKRVRLWNAAMGQVQKAIRGEE